VICVSAPLTHKPDTAGSVCVVAGGSGTGKTSLFRALTSAQAITNGCVMLNGADYHQSARLFAGQVGLVPQEDIVHPELTVWSALMYAAQLRLPKDTSTKEHLERVQSVLDSVQLTNRAHSTIKHLSGGERKRVSIALELITEPNLLYLDEPTSGLDPYRERQIMELLQRLAKNGRTILVTTHSTASLDLCDLLLVMGVGGRLVYFGPPDDALAHFGCTSYNDIYSVVGDTSYQVLRQQRRFWKSDIYKQFGCRRGHSNCASSLAKPQRVSSFGAFGWLSQFWLLCRRYLEIMANDRANVALLLAQAPLIVLIIIFVFPSNSFEAVIGSSDLNPLRHASPILFLLVISAIWFGTSNSVREIVKENPIYIRERMAFLSPSAYFLSKFSVLAVLCVVQCAILIAGVGYWLSWFGVNDIDVLSMFGVLLLASSVGLSMGLLLSSIARSSDQAVSLTPIVLIPQIVFSGMFIPDDAGAVVSIISKLHAAKWAFGSMGYLARVNEKIDSLPVYTILKNGSFEGEVTTKLLAMVALLVTTMITAMLAISSRRGR
jgi:ABC-type multidrug transport system ATPase subunit